MFAEFEKLLHEQVEKGEALTPGWLEEEYVKLVHAYHGSEVIVDEEIAAEWSRIPHFYYNFYVYKYATGFCAAVALAQSFREEGEAAIKRYLSFLQSGGSDYPLAILQQTGIDLSKPQPIKEAMLTFARLVEEFAALSGGASG
jgi:oligoendopeptidase F